jgi:hypothetical protein
MTFTYLFIYCLFLISNSYILPLNIPFVFVWCYIIATFAHQVLASYFLGGEPSPSTSISILLSYQLEAQNWPIRGNILTCHLVLVNNTPSINR